MSPHKFTFFPFFTCANPIDAPISTLGRENSTYAHVVNDLLYELGLFF